MTTLEFSYNWNNKLDCPMHTTLRLRNDVKYFPGSRLEEILLKKGERISLGYVEVVSVRIIKLEDINDFIAGLDTGYRKAACIGLLKKMYKNKNVNWETQELAFCLLQKIKVELPRYTRPVQHEIDL